MAQAPMIFDEFGRPFIVLRETQTRRLTGIGAHKANMFSLSVHSLFVSFCDYFCFVCFCSLAARTVASILRTSLGPKGMDKMLVSPDNDVIVTNDGATIMEKVILCFFWFSGFC